MTERLTTALRRYRLWCGGQQERSVVSWILQLFPLILETWRKLLKVRKGKC